MSQLQIAQVTTPQIILHVDRQVNRSSGVQAPQPAPIMGFGILITAITSHDRPKIIKQTTPYTIKLIHRILVEAQLDDLHHFFSLCCVCLDFPHSALERVKEAQIVDIYVRGLRRLSNKLHSPTFTRSRKLQVPNSALTSVWFGSILLYHDSLANHPMHVLFDCVEYSARLNEQMMIKVTVNILIDLDNCSFWSMENGPSP